MERRSWLRSTTVISRSPPCCSAMIDADGPPRPRSLVDSDRERPRLDRRADHDRGHGLSVRQELIKQRLKICHGRGMDHDQEAVLTGDAMTFADLWQ